VLTIVEPTGFGRPEGSGERGNVVALSELCKAVCIWPCADRRPPTALIAAVPRKGAARSHRVAVDREHGRIRFACQDWMLSGRAMAARLCALHEVLAGVPPQCLPLLAEISDGEDSEAGLLSFCSRDPGAILIPDHMFVLSGGYREHRALARANATSWDARSDWIVWRGSTHGVGTITKPDLSSDDPDLIARVRLCVALRDTPLVDAKLFRVTQSDNVALDTERLARAGILGDYLSPLTWHGLKFAIDIDGNSNSWSTLFLRLLMGCCVLKVASGPGYRQWYYDALEPWLHYVPVKCDLSDLNERIAWCRSNLAACREIAARGQAFALARDLASEVAAAVGRVHDAHRSGKLRCMAP
jgi:hypothetical protein